MDKLITYDNLQDILKGKGMLFFTGHMNLNLIGIRTMNRNINNFDDKFCMAWEDNGEKKLFVNNDFTTDPGIYYLQKELLSPKGCAILVPGQYRGLWKIGFHRGKYKALVQDKPCSVYRDRNKDNYLDFDSSTIETGMFGINKHHGYESAVVNNNSAACQVDRYKKDLDFSLSVAKKSVSLYGENITYTLITSNDFI